MPMQRTSSDKERRAGASVTASAADVEAIVNARHGDPFAVLGPHAVVRDGGKVVAVRAFVPGATEVRVRPDVPGLEPRVMARVHAAGFFEALVPEVGEPFPYRLEIDEPGTTTIVHDAYRFPSTLSDFDLHLLGEGRLYRNYDSLGAHLRTVDGVEGTTFAVWAPNARRVSVVGDFNRWDGRRHPMRLHPGNGVWEMFIPGVREGVRYKYEIIGASGELLPLKADPYAFAFEPEEPRTASVVARLDYVWNDDEWMATRVRKNALDSPIAIYEVHLGSWRRADGNRFLTYRELGRELGEYVSALGFTHVELLPVSEHPFYASWGYQPLGLFAPTRRYGDPTDFMAFVDELHRRGIGVIIDWVPAHFPRDAHGLAYFDGTHLYEHSDPRQREHPDWGTLVYNYGRYEVTNYLIGNAVFWLDRYHIDGLRVDAVASMLYLDYSRRPGEWVPNRFGGNENLEAIDFLKRMNEVVYGTVPGVMTAAEESTAWPQVSRPVYVGGLGFGFKWNMGWMHDMLDYLSHDPVHRKYHHNQVTFALLYAWNENFVLPLSHDEVVHGKGALHQKVPGDDWQKFASLRALYGYMYGHPGKKLLFMGDEFGQTREWYHDTSLDWHLLAYGPYHGGLQRLVADVNAVYRHERALHEIDFEPSGFAWIDCGDWESSIVSFLRRSRDPEDFVVVVSNFTPVPRFGYRIGVPRGGFYRELLNTDSALYGGSNLGNAGGLPADDVPWHGHGHSLCLTVPPLATIYFKPQR
jgi:1,4-alpha-glucan branching enzyme